MSTHVPLEEFLARLAGAAAHLGIRAKQIAQQRVKLVLGPHSQLKGIHERNKVLRDFCHDMSASIGRRCRCRIDVRMLDRRRHAQGKTMCGRRVVHLGVKDESVRT